MCKPGPGASFNPFFIRASIESCSSTRTAIGGSTTAPSSSVSIPSSSGHQLRALPVIQPPSTAMFQVSIPSSSGHQLRGGLGHVPRVYPGAGWAGFNPFFIRASIERRQMNEKVVNFVKEINVSIPSSSGHQLRAWPTLERRPKGTSWWVSIPSSSGHQLRGRLSAFATKQDLTRMVSIPSSSGHQLRV